jgi:DNA-binding FadR family transcriptional regulator
MTDTTPTPTATAYTPRPVGRGQAHELIAQQLRTAIIAGQLPPGSRLPTEIELGEAFGVSRATVREALGSLVGQGLVTKARGLNGGSFVAEASVDQASESLHLTLQRLGLADGLSLAEVVEIRLLLEVPAARLAAGRRTDADVDELRACAHRHDHANELGDRRFHRAVAVASGNRLLQLAIEPINLVLSAQLDASRYPQGFLTDIDDHHQQIAEAIAAGDEDLSEALMRAHLEALDDVFSEVWKRPT